MRLRKIGSGWPVNAPTEIDPRARVVVASGYSNDPVMADFKSYGFSGVIAKPFSVEMLATVLGECLE